MMKMIIITIRMMTMTAPLMKLIYDNDYINLNMIMTLMMTIRMLIYNNTYDNDDSCDEYNNDLDII